MRNAGISRLCWIVARILEPAWIVTYYIYVCTAIAARCTRVTRRDPLATMAMRGRLSVINSEHCQYLDYKHRGAMARNNEAIINEARLCGRGSVRDNASLSLSLSLRKA